MRIIGATVIIVLASAGSANAVCTKPVGNYAGTAVGRTYVRGSLYNEASMMFTFSFAANGSGSAFMIAKDTVGNLPNRKYEAGSSWTAAGHTFNATNCRGSILNSNGTVSAYVSTQSGSSLEIMDYSNRDEVNAYVVKLNKL